MSTQEVIDKLRKESDQLLAQVAWIEKYRDRLDALSGLSPFSLWVDFDQLSHDEIIKVIQAFPGIWKKTLNGAEEGRIDYETEFDGQRIRCWAGEPPPNCRVEEVDLVVPAQPERTVKVKKIICKEPEMAPA